MNYRCVTTLPFKNLLLIKTNINGYPNDEDQKDLEILVEGHTDTDKMRSNAHPKDNWELSVLRATSVVKIMLGNSNMDPTTISASGRSQFIPIDLENKAKNRRIEVVLIPKLDELFEIINN